MASKVVKKNSTNYKDVERKDFDYREVYERLKDYKSIVKDYAEDFMRIQASRCQDCGIPFCQGAGCPIDNKIPDFNATFSKGLWQDALDIIHSTNHFPEITGTVCPAPCEDACTLSVGLEAVTIRNIELAIVEKGYELGLVKPEPPQKRTGKKVAVIGSGPAGLFACRELNKMGHSVVVYEKDEKAGGYLRYGIPDFKLEKKVIDRRLELLKEEGIVFKTGVQIGKNKSVKELKKEYDAVLITCGAREPRDLPIEGRRLQGIHFATDYLIQSNKRVDGIKFKPDELIDAKGKNVLVIGGGDTGSDCIGTANRQGAKSVLQIEILPKPPLVRASETPWPMYAKKLRTSSSQKEGCERKWCILTKQFHGKEGKVQKISGVEIKWAKKDGKFEFTEIPGTEFEYETGLVLLAMGFVHPEHTNLLTDFGLELDQSGNIKTDSFGFGKTNVPGVFAAGDAVRGPSLVVWAFAHGRDAARMVDSYLMK